MKINISSEKRFSRFICLALIYLFIVNMSNGLSQLTGISVSMISTIFKAIIGVYFLTMLPMLVSRFTKNMMILVVVSLQVAVFNYALFPSLQVYFNDTIINYFTMCLPIALSAMSIEDIDYFKKCLLVTARIMAVMSLLLLFGIFTQRINFYTDSYSMGFGYSMLTPILILFYKLFTEERNEIIDVVSLGTLLLVLISYGSRGPLLAILLFVVFYSSRVFVERKKYYAIVLIILGAVILDISYEMVLVALGTLLTNYGINSRTIYMLTNSSLTQTNRLAHRNFLWDALIPEIRRNPFAIRGINAEWKVIGFYAHNMIIEVIYQLGVILGGAVIILIGYTIIRQLFSTSRSTGDEIIIILMFSTIPGLMFSNSLWISSSFWIWVGVTAGVWKTRTFNKEDRFQHENSIR